MSISNAKIETKPTFDKVTLNEFENQLSLYRAKLKDTNTADSLKKVIVSDFTDLIKLYINLGDFVDSIAYSPEKDTIETYLVNYSIPEDFKSTIILHRDVYLELNKAKILEKERTKIREISAIHFEKSKAVLESQFDDFVNKIDVKKNILVKGSKVAKKTTKKLSLEQNPWVIYKQQFEALHKQFSDIENAKIVSDRIVKVFDNLKQTSTIIFQKHNLLDKQLQDNINYILEKVDAKDSHKELMFFIDEQLAFDVTLGNNLSALTDELDFKINQLEKVKIPIDTQNGLLIQREIDLKKSVQKWFDYQILPDIMDLITIENSLKSINSISLTNLKNNLQISENEDPKDETNRFKPNLNNLQSELNELKSKGEIIIARVEDKIKSQLQVSNLLNGKVFLEVPFNSSLNLNSNTFLTSVKENVVKSLSFFNAQIKKNTDQQASSQIELATQCLKHRMFKQADDHYDSLFLNKKFIGDLFLISRQEQEETLNKTLNQWQSGFNKSVLVVGERLSGRSTFLDYTSKKYFGKNIVVLQPNSLATIDGRKFATTNDLKEALTYIKNNNTKSTKPVILIDDLELWRDKNHKLLANIRALINFIETESDDAFVMASTSKAMMRHLNARLTFSDAFSTLIDVSKTDRNEIIEALMIRHGAAHRKLISRNLEPMTPKMIQKAILKLSSKYHLNLGDVLQAWTHDTFVQENEKIMYDEANYEFPDFFSKQELIILKQATIFKIVTEYGLKQALASGYENDYKSSLKRLINTKVLLRSSEGNLYINPVILNDVNLFMNQRN